MNWPATLVNSLWVGSSLPAWNTFRRALNRPDKTQQHLLGAMLADNMHCAYGRTHGFGQIAGYADFVRRVPLTDFETLAPWIDRIRSGERGVLTTAPVTHLLPTSGSTGAGKLIPFTQPLQRQFNQAIGPWIADLALKHPQILFGPAYWSITPPQKKSTTGSSVVPVGFADDADYLGGAKARLVRAGMVVPGRLSDTGDLEEFRFQTLLALLKEPDLRLISVWHPSFLTLLLDALPEMWEKILAQLNLSDQRRVHQLEQANPLEPETLWPHLRVISCWGDGHAAMPLAE